MQQRLTFGEEIEGDLRLDERTKVIGRQGVALARATLAACRDPFEPRSAEINFAHRAAA